MTGGPVHQVNCLHADDLIDDHEVASVSDDRLAHEGIADQLTALVNTVKTPSNIALYGPWGSGKSGIANLLKAQVDGKNGVKFARFDAFKYAELPLRRNFVSAIASELGQKSSKYHDDLYNGRTKTDIHVPAATIAKILGIFALLIVGLTVVLGVLVAIVAWLQKGDFTDSYRSLSKAAVLAGLAPAALLAGLVALASKTFQVDRSVAKPESDEQFERLFRDLVADSRAKRLVVFIDELDRCSASEVVATLDTVRTFLGVERCVFVIAADQQVLEEALTRAAKQETPADEANPYYSTGSAYLDKVFQYQVSLPPLLSQSVSNYASTLLQGREGLWKEINAEYVLSVLIPTHVTSPRRVKHLLNTFALTYRLAQERHSSHLLAEDPGASAAAMARLVCLRVEFPLFARHLEVDASLPDLVLALMRDPKATFAPSVSDRARSLAESYALEGAAPGTILVDDDGDSDDEADREAAQRTSAAHNKQLLNYLSRTRRVNGPSRDLIYLQSSGTVLGLDGDLAHAVESAAEDGDIQTLQRRISGLDEPSREAVLQLLAQQIRTGAGLAGPNTARSLLLLTEAMPGLPIGNVVDTVAEAISVLHEDNHVLDDETIASAWNLAKSGSDSGAAALRALVVNVATSADWGEASDFLLDDAVIAHEASPEGMAAYLASNIVDSDGTHALSRLFRLGDEDLIALLGNVAEEVVDRATEAVSVHAQWEAQRKAAAAPAAARTTATPAQASEAEPEPYDPGALFNALVSESKARETAVQHQVLRILLRIDAQAARSAALRLLGETEPVTDPTLVTAVLAAAARRVVTDFPGWLNAISPAAVREQHAAQMRTIYEKLWDADATPAEVEPALKALSPLGEALPDDRRVDLTSRVVESVDFWARNTEEASALSKVVARTRIFAAVGVIDAAAVAHALVESLQDTLSSSVAVVDHHDDLFTFVATEGIEALRLVADDFDSSRLKGVFAEAETSPWLGPVDRVAMTLELIQASGVDIAGVSEKPKTDQVADLIADYGVEASHAASLWVALLKPEPTDLASVYDRLIGENAVTEEFASAAASAHAGWEPDAHAAFVARYLSDPEAPVPSDRDLRVLGWTSLDDERVADLLCARFAAATNNTQRQSVVTLWRRAKVSNPGARRRLIEEIVYGLLDLRTGSSPNVSAVELALSALDELGAPLPYGVKGALGQRVKNVVQENKSLNDRALRVMPKLGYSTTSGFFGRNKRVDFDE